MNGSDVEPREKGSIISYNKGTAARNIEVRHPKSWVVNRSVKGRTRPLHPACQPTCFRAFSSADTSRGFFAARRYHFS